MGEFWKTSAVDREQIVTLYLEGESVKVIAHRFGISRTYVTKLAKRLGHSVRRIRRHSLQQITDGACR